MTSIRRSNRMFRLVVGVIIVLSAFLIAMMLFSTVTSDPVPADTIELAYW